MRTGMMVLLGLCLVASGCGKDGAKPLICHVGGTMCPVLEKLSEDYEAETGQKIEINSGGSGEVLAHIELQKSGDVYVCHDPFLDTLMKKNLGIDGWVLAELTPVIVVKKGNPKKITGLADLTRPEIEVWLTDYKRSTLGRMLPTIFAKAGIDFDKLNRDKKINTHKKGGYVANMVVTGNGDAAMCWLAVAALRKKDLDVVTIPTEHLPVPKGEPNCDTITSATGKDYALTPVRVTIATLKCSEQPEAAQKFAEYIASDRAAEVLKEYGFTITNPRKAYDDGKAMD